MARMTKFDPSTRLLARQALREAVRQWPLPGEEVTGSEADVERAHEERISLIMGAPPEPEMVQRPAAPGAASLRRQRRASSLARLLLGALAVAFGVGLAWVATARMRRA